MLFLGLLSLVGCLRAAAPAAPAAPVTVPDAGLSDAGLPDPAPGSIDALAVPLAGYDSDDKLSYGLAGQIQWVGDIQPYRAQIAFQLLFTTAGVQSHWVRFDSPRLFGSDLKLWARLEYHREKFAPYYGPGDQSSSDPASAPGLAAERAFQYDREFPLGRLGAAYPLLKSLPLYAFAMGAFAWQRDQLYAGSLMALEPPLGANGGRIPLLDLGAFVDTRDNEANATRGFLAEISGRDSPSWLGAQHPFWGWNVRAIGYVPFRDWLVFAFRAEVDGLSALAPFYALSLFGGADALEGVGGQYSLRGVPKARYIGRYKALASAEARFRAWEWTVFDGPLDLGFGVFSDVGRVWQADGTDPSFWRWHPGAGAGVRLWRRSFVIRADLASSADRAFNLYVMFGHFF
jgi:hypothetical protein